MQLLIQAVPLVALVVLLGTGRVGAPAACVAAMVLSVPAALIQLGAAQALPGFALAALAGGGWLAVVPLGFIAGGLVIHEAIAGLPRARAETAPEDVVDRVFTAAFLLGPFTECATGFGVGSVFAIGVLRGVGITGVYAALIGLTAQSFIPWGGLGPGTSVGAALADLPGQALAARDAWQTAFVLLLLLPATWVWLGRAGHRVAGPARARQTVWVAATGVVLVALHRFVPWEMCGLLATGGVLSVKQLTTAPPRGIAGWRAALLSAFPYLLIVALLGGLRSWHGAPSLQPFADLPALALNHGVVAIWIAAAILLLLSGRGGAILAAAARRGRRPALILLSFVVLARVLAQAGIPQALARALAASFGAAAPFAAPLLAGAAGFFGGTNVASNAAMMPLQASLGRLAGLDPVVLPAVQNGTPFLMISLQLAAIAAGLAGGDATPGRIWRYGWPIGVIALVVGVGSILVG